MNAILTRGSLLSLAAATFAALMSACAPFPVPDDWPVRQKADNAKARGLYDVLSTSRPVGSLTSQERALLTFLTDNDRINEAIGKTDRHGNRTWRIVEIFLVEPGRQVSVLCEEGHFQEALYFRYNPSNSVWYRVEDFENPNAAAVPALIVQR